MMEFRPFAFCEVQAQSHGIGHGKDVGEQDRRVEIETLQWLQRNFAGQLGVFCQGEKTAGALARRAVLGQVTPSLAHDPDGCGVDRFAAQRAQKTIVAKRRERHRIRVSVEIQRARRSSSCKGPMRRG